VPPLHDVIFPTPADGKYRRITVGLDRAKLMARGRTPTDSANAGNAEFLDDPKSDTPYLAVQTPEPRVVSFNSLVNTPVSVPFLTASDPMPGLLGNVATLTRTRMPTNANQASNQPVYEVYTNCSQPRPGQCRRTDRSDLLGLQKKLLPGNTVSVLGQTQSMNVSFHDMGVGLLFTAIFVCLPSPHRKIHGSDRLATQTPSQRYDSRVTYLCWE
jgi:hypothetical protein